MGEFGYSAWMAKADNDLLNIENNIRSHRTHWDTVCFHAQQAGEKLLKGFLVRHGRTPPRTHELVALLCLCVTIEPDLADLEDDCRRLSAYAVGARCPDDFFEPDEESALKMVSVAMGMRNRIVALLEEKRLP